MEQRSSEVEISPADVGRLDQIGTDGVAQMNNPKEIKLRKFVGTGASAILNFSSDEMEQLIRGFVESAREKGLSVFSAGVDYPLHATVSDGKYPKPRDKEQVSDESIKAIDAEPEMQAVKALLNDLGITFDRVVIAPGGTIMFAASAYPNTVRVARAKMDLLYRKHGLETKAGDDILFSTAVRLSPENTSVTSDQAQKYLELAQNLQAEVTSKPIKVVTLPPYFGPSSNYIPKSSPL